MSLGRVVIEVRLKPGAKNDRASLSPEGLLDIAVTSAPIEGKANEHLVKYLSKALHIPKSAIAIIRGEKCRQKTVAITGVTSDEIKKTFQNDANCAK